jgi:ribosomal protein L40E
MSAPAVPETIQIPPHPRILRALAEIDFDRWQCVAELVDNGFDEFLDMERAGEVGEETPRVHVALPKDARGRVVVSDNGRGMSLDRIKDATRAGFSGNDPLSKLGLFGMGFNVATARLGGVTNFLSTRVGDRQWVGVRIDVREMGEDFSVPVERVAKDDPAEHGTKIEIFDLNQLALPFTDPTHRTRLRSQLGAIYSHLLEGRGYELVVDRTPVSPYRHCVWSAERSVTRAGKEIKARIEIDETLPRAKVCLECGAWQDEENERCHQCDSEGLDSRERRVRGWLGISRELSSKEFGIDFLRNGRKIMRFDRRLFEWVDPDDPSGAAIPEYPVEVPYQRGRIVGEIHLDHVPVIYTKDAFDFSDRAWKTAVRIIRGETSLLPKTANARGDSPNESPLAQLHTGYRRNDPGANYLTAGDGEQRLDTSDWVAAFHKGDSEYEQDTKWWEAATDHDRLKEEIKLDKERRKRAQEESDRDERRDPTNEFFEGGEDDTLDAPTPRPAPAPPRPLTERERIEGWEAAARPLPALKGEYASRMVGGQAVSLDAFAVSGSPLVPEEGAVRLPVHLVSRPKGAFRAFVDLDHPLFVEFDDDPEDLVLFALAQMLITRSRSGSSAFLASVYADLKERYLGRRAISAGSLQAEANQLLTDLQVRMQPLILEDPMRPWHNALAEHERALTRERIVDALKTADTDAVVAGGGYMPLVPPGAIPRIVAQWPEAFMGDRLFARPYQGLEPASQQQALGRVVGYLNDIAWLAGSPVGADRDELIRARLSLRLMPEELAASDSSG